MVEFPFVSPFTFSGRKGSPSISTDHGAGRLPASVFLLSLFTSGLAFVGVVGRTAVSEWSNVHRRRKNGEKKEEHRKTCHATEMTIPSKTLDIEMGVGTGNG